MRCYGQHPHRKRSAAADVRSLARDVYRVDRVKAATEWMDKHVGYGWKRQMEVRANYMDQDMPRRWVTGYVPSWKMLRKFEEYCARFGYKMPATHMPSTTFQTPVYKPDIREELDNLINT
jgi:hypothetical protein